MRSGRQRYSTFDEAARRRAFLIAAPVIVAAVVGMMLLPKPKDDVGTDRPRPAEASRVLSRATPTPTPTPTPIATPTAAPKPMLELDDRDRETIVVRSRLFLDALLRYETGTASRAVRSMLRRTATRRLARELLDHPPRRPAGLDGGVGKIAGLEPTDDPDSPVVAVSATIDRDGRLSPLTVVLDRGRGSWLVSDAR